MLKSICATWLIGQVDTCQKKFKNQFKKVK
jgi:hypothetical protein